MRHASFQAVSPAGLGIDTVTTETDRILVAAHPAAQMRRLLIAARYLAGPQSL
jgi:hypothetical protein